MFRSDLVVCGNEYIAQRAKVVNANKIKIIPTVVDINKYFVSKKNFRNSCHWVDW